MEKILSENKLILGTVQFGLKYGINNERDKPSQTDVEKILQYGFSNGINTLDTADAYGNATGIIGDFHRQNKKTFKVITKFKNIESIASLDAWIDSTLDKLCVESLFACMYHSVEDYLNNPKIIDKLTLFYEKGYIKNIGVSIYSNEQFAKVIDDPSINLIQLPYNLLDNVNLRGDLIEKAKKNNKIIHVRSVFLQGLFFMDLDKLPAKLKPLKPELEYLQQIIQKHDISMQTLALKYVASNAHIDGILIGVDNMSQLQANIDSLNMEIPQSLIHHIDSISTQYVELLNPVNWA